MNIDRSNINNIVISRTDRIGDVILTLPLVYKTKEIFPESKIYFLCNSYVRDLVSLSKDIDEILIYQGNFLHTASLFKKIKPDLIVNAFPVFNISLSAFLSGIKYRIGSAYRWYSFLYNLKVYEHRKNCLFHESVYNINLLKPLFPDVNYNFSYKLYNEKFPSLSSFSLPEKYIILHPSSGGSSIDVPPEILNNFLKIYDGNVKIIITGSEKDIEFNQKILSGIENKNIINLTGKFSLAQLVSLISKSTLVIANSTGPLHIAGMLNIPVIGFYPDVAPMNETRWGPLSDEKIIFRPQKVTENEILKIVNLINSKKQ